MQAPAAPAAGPARVAERAGMQALHSWPVAQRQRLLGVFTDIDDTLTTHGAITPDAWKALADLRAAGLQVFGITGRPIGWCEPLIKGDAAHGLAPWPLDALVAENGTVAWVADEAGGGFRKIYQQDAATRAHNRSRIHTIGQRIEREVPGALLSRDSVGRETDLSIDHAEFARLSPEAMAQVLRIMQAEGLHTTVSSIHTHGCFGLFTKWTGATWLVQQLLGRSLQDELDRWVFVGDSGNDVAMFQHFMHSVGVAKIRRVADSLSHLPRYMAPSERGAGFAEVAAAILSART